MNLRIRKMSYCAKRATFIQDGRAIDLPHARDLWWFGAAEWDEESWHAMRSHLEDRNLPGDDDPNEERRRA